MLVYIVCALIAYIFIKKYRSSLKLGGYGERYVLITGCDSGFGNLLARRLDELGLPVFAGCLTQDAGAELQQACSDRLRALQLDVTSDASIEKCLEEVKKTLPPSKGLWAVVNNAGLVGTIGPTAWHERRDYEVTLAVNLYGVILVTKAFLPLVLQERGRIVNMASITGRYHFGVSCYAVSKAAVEAYSDVLRQDLYDTGASVHIIEPGTFRTAILNVENNARLIRDKMARLPQVVKDELPENAEENLIKRMEVANRRADPDLSKVVNAYVHAIICKYPKARYLVGTDANVFFRVLMYLPEWLSDYIMNRAIKKLS